MLVSGGFRGRGVDPNRRDRPDRRAGPVHVYCNIHPRMSGFLVVRDNAWFAQPSADGSFTIPNVPPGTYTLKAWHERAGESSQQVTVAAGGVANVVVAMDAGGYQY